VIFDDGNRAGSTPATEPFVARTRSQKLECRRLVSLDVFRGLVMVVDARRAHASAEVARVFRTALFWASDWIHTQHVEWQGCCLHDLIQPAFSFLVARPCVFDRQPETEGANLRTDAGQRKHARHLGQTHVLASINTITSPRNTSSETNRETTPALAAGSATNGSVAGVVYLRGFHHQNHL